MSAEALLRLLLSERPVFLVLLCAGALLAALTNAMIHDRTWPFMQALIRLEMVDPMPGLQVVHVPASGADPVLVAVLWLALIAVLAVAVWLMPLMRLVALVVNGSRSRASARLLLLGYVEAIVAFGILYYALQVGSLGNIAPFLDGAHAPTSAEMLRSPGGSIFFDAAHQLPMLFDALYFSALTQTTLGAGPLLPGTPLAKLMVVIQVLLGLYIIALALAERLSARPGG